MLIFLRDNLSDFLEDFPLNIHENIWFQHDGALHYSRRVLSENTISKFLN